ncbi:MAG: glycoside hydrolase, partial [Fimbriimonadaceae bacterium]
TTGLPTIAQGLGRIGFAIAPSNPRVLYATVDSGDASGLYRSNDAGESWAKVNSERRLVSRGDDFAEVKVHPKNPESVFVADTSFYRSDDGGKNFTCLKGSPGGDDYHRIWINPNNPDIILTAADQGAAVSLNGGETWSSWYNQSTAQLYHVAADNLFPYSLYGGQQESGSAMVSSRGNDGQLTFREWHPAGGDEYAYLAPDPLNGRYVYGGRVNRYDKVTGEILNLRPTAAHRTLRTAPLVFSQADPKQLFFGGNILFRTSDGGKTWDTLSPDLSRKTWEVPASVGKFSKPDLVTRRGVIYTVAPSPKDANVIWCGTDDGLLWTTKDAGKNWENVTQNMLTPWSKVSLMDAGHFDTATAYAAINRIRLDDQKPHILKTHDGGKTWQEIVKGLPDGPVNVIREDPIRAGLLYCGTETGVYFSLDDGANWQSLRLNMPATSVRDLIIKDNDLCIATHGRGFWILDNLSAIRSPEFGEGRTTFFPPAPAYLLERNTNADTPLPQDEPVSKNPPDGAIFDYFLASDAAKVEIHILGEDGGIIRKFASSDAPVTADPLAITVMPGWARPPRIVKANKGLHRFVWDMRLAPAASGGGRGGGLPISAVWGDTPFGPQGAYAKPGMYKVVLIVDGVIANRTLELKADPRK